MNVIAVPAHMDKTANAVTAAQDLVPENLWSIEYTGDTAAIPLSNSMES